MLSRSLVDTTYRDAQLKIKIIAETGVLLAVVSKNDNPVERESVYIALPDITIADFPANISKLPKTIDMIAENYISITRITEENPKKHRSINKIQNVILQWIRLLTYKSIENKKLTIWA